MKNGVRFIHYGIEVVRAKLQGMKLAAPVDPEPQLTSPDLGPPPIYRCHRLDSDSSPWHRLTCGWVEVRTDVALTVTGRRLAAGRLGTPSGRAAPSGTCILKNRLSVFSRKPSTLTTLKALATSPA